MISEMIMNTYDKSIPNSQKLFEMWKEVKGEVKRNYKDFKEITSKVHSEFYNLLNYITTDLLSVYINSKNVKLYAKFNLKTNLEDDKSKIKNQ